MPQVSKDLKEILQGISPICPAIGVTPITLECKDLLPTAYGLRAFSWLHKDNITGTLANGFFHNNLFYPAPDGWGTTPMGTFFLRDGILYSLDNGALTMHGQVIPCTRLVVYQGCLGVLNPHGKGGLLVYPPHKLPLAASRVGEIEMLGVLETGKADTLGCVWISAGNLGNLLSFFVQGNYLTLCYEKGLQAWNIIYDFNNTIGGHSIMAAAGNHAGGFFLTVDGFLWAIKETKVQNLGYDWLFRGRDMEMQYLELNELLVLRDKTSGEVWFMNKGLCSSSVRGLAVGEDPLTGDCWILGSDGRRWIMDTYRRAPFHGYIKTLPSNLGIPGPKRFAFMGAACSQNIPIDVEYQVDDHLASGTLNIQDNFLAIDWEGLVLSLRIAPIGLESGEFIYTALLFYNPVDKRFLNDVVSNG